MPEPPCRRAWPPALAPAEKLSFENDDGTIMAEEIFQEQLLSYRPIPPPAQLPDCPEPSGPAAEPAAAAAAAPAAPARGAAAAGTAGPAARGAGARPAAAGGRGAPGKSNAAAEARVKQLGGEAEVRAKVVGVRDGLSRGLAALAALAAGNPAFTAQQLDALRPLVLPLLRSPFVGGGAAFECCAALAGALPGDLSSQARTIACSLRLVMLTEAEGDAADWQHLARRRCVCGAVSALQAATGGVPSQDGTPVPAALRRALHGPAYMFCFPILRAVMRWVGGRFG